MKILTYNIALLDFKILGFKILRPTRYIGTRLKAIPNAVKELKADIICFQEVYKKSHKLKLKKELASDFPYSYFKKTTVLIGFDNGLIVFSKHPIEHTHFENLLSQPFEERLLTRKGLIGICVTVNDRKYFITNTHTTASGSGFQQDNARIEALRDSQINQITKTTDTFSKKFNCDVALICGDFNCGPQVSESNYSLLSYKNYIDTYRLSNKDEHPTWDPENVLNQDSPVFKSSPKQRIDFILCNKSSIGIFNQITSNIIFIDPVLTVQDNKKIPLSDHYGVIAKFD